MGQHTVAHRALQTCVHSSHAHGTHTGDKWKGSQDVAVAWLGIQRWLLWAARGRSGFDCYRGSRQPRLASLSVAETDLELLILMLLSSAGDQIIVHSPGRCFLRINYNKDWVMFWLNLEQRSRFLDSLVNTVMTVMPSYLRCEVPVENAFEVKVAEAHCYVIGQFHSHSPRQIQVTV